jgi:decaprenyl-phosphate phosphoribosyltransferase
VTVRGTAVAGRRLDAAALVRAARPHQWTKNLVVLAGLLFSGRFQDAQYWPEALAVLAAYCLASSASYLVNDVRDAELDRRHARKRTRPVAAGELSPRAAVTAAAVAAVAAVGLAAAVNWASAALLVAFLGLQAAYSVWLKHVPFADVLAIALGFVLRAAAGAVAVGVRLSWWLVLCTALLALYLELAKRRSELRAGGAAGRPVLARYGAATLDRLVIGAAGAAFAAYVAYAFSGPTAPAMALTVPLAAAGLARYAWLVRRDNQGEEPDRLLVRDPALLLTILAWAALAAAILAIEV